MHEFRKHGLALAAAMMVSGLAAAGCDVSVNPAFESDYARAQKERRGDPFGSLSKDQQALLRYSRAGEDQQGEILAQYGALLVSNVQGARTTLNGMKPPESGKDVVEDCGQAIDAALAYFRSPDERTSADALDARLLACHDAAKASPAARGEEASYLDGLKRSASVARIVVAMGAVKLGDSDSARARWRTAEKAVRDDAPGFKLRPEYFVQKH